MDRPTSRHFRSMARISSAFCLESSNCFLTAAPERSPKAWKFGGNFRGKKWEKNPQKAGKDQKTWENWWNFGDKLGEVWEKLKRNIVEWTLITLTLTSICLRLEIPSKPFQLIALILKFIDGILTRAYTTIYNPRLSRNKQVSSDN